MSTNCIMCNKRDNIVSNIENDCVHITCRECWIQNKNICFECGRTGPNEVSKIIFHTVGVIMYGATAFPYEK